MPIRYLDLPSSTASASEEAVISLGVEFNGPTEDIRGYSRDQFIETSAGARDGSAELPAQGRLRVQLDSTEGRLAVKIDPSGELLHRSST